MRRSVPNPRASPRLTSHSRKLWLGRRDQPRQRPDAAPAASTGGRPRHAQDGPGQPGRNQISLQASRLFFFPNYQVILLPTSNLPFRFPSPLKRKTTLTSCDTGRPMDSCWGGGGFHAKLFTRASLRWLRSRRSPGFLVGTVIPSRATPPRAVDPPPGSLVFPEPSQRRARSAGGGPAGTCPPASARGPAFCLER